MGFVVVWVCCCVGLPFSILKGELVTANGLKVAVIGVLADHSMMSSVISVSPCEKGRTATVNG